MTSKKVSLRDIARSLGVSKTLISLVINNHGDEHGINKLTQQRVLDKIKELNYTPNLVARGLRLGKTNTIGLIVSDIANPFYSKIARQIEDLTAQKGYNLIICSTDEKPDKEVKLIRMLRNRQVDGLIISSSQSNKTEFEKLLKEKYPFVTIDRQVPDIDLNFVGVDNFIGAQKATEHLIKQGCRKIAIFAVTPIHVSSIHDRIEGSFKAMKDSGITFDKHLLREISFDDVRNKVRKDITDLVIKNNKIDAIFAVNNKIAISCLETLSDLNIAIPNDMAIACFDDIELFRFNNPPITAVAQPVEDIATNAVEILLDEMSGTVITTQKKIKKLPTHLIIRRSTTK